MSFTDRKPYPKQKQADTAAIDAEITRLVTNRTRMCEELAQVAASMTDAQRNSAFTELQALCVEIAQAQFKRDDIIRETFYR